MKLGELIAVTREARGISQRQLERRTGVSNEVICQIETGKVESPGFWTVMKLAKELDLNLKRLAQCEP